MHVAFSIDRRIPEDVEKSAATSKRAKDASWLAAELRSRMDCYPRDSAVA